MDSHVIVYNNVMTSLSVNKQYIPHGKCKKENFGAESAEKMLGMF